MARKVKRTSRQSGKQLSANLKWIAGGIAGVGIALVALVMFAGRSDSSSQKQFDPNFEPEVSGAPRVEVVESDVINYGDVKLGTTVNTTYTVRNLGDEQLVVLGEPRVELVEGC